MVDEATELDVLEEDDRELIHSIFEFNDTVVREVMVPRTDMVTIDAAAHLPHAMALFLKAGYSRIPVIERDADDVIGHPLPARPRAARASSARSTPRRSRSASSCARRCSCPTR